ncbi:calyx/pep [Artaxa digramma nucleopolyhedrovirus]|uniref:Calyx/pep n=1 Tax=Artaxa digramma nucleopolyhedrovirus TaxID=3070910 RepID=A0AAE6UZP8_9ABAC|nr:calyx/pep [Euproctis digramma nucleopolyhedrovirus]QHB21775.1 calyx/pep [Artaxa digramma nucleopolyhedrovirus]
MSFTVLTKKVQESPVTAFLEQSWVLWVCADDVLQLLRLPISVLQTIPLRHKKCWNDFRNATASGSSCRFDGNKIFIDIYGLGNLCNRVNSACADYLCTLFIAEIYTEACAQNSSSGGGCIPQPQPLPFPPPPTDPCTPDCNGRNNHHHHHHHHNDRELLERIAKQNDLIVSGLGQLCINNSNQHLEITNILNAIKLQNVTISGQLTQIIDLIDTQLADVAADLRKLVGQIDDSLENLLSAVNKALAQLQDGVRNELTNINSILNNLTSSVTNINATLNNLLQAINNLDLSDLTNLVEQINAIQTTVNEILGILTPEIPISKRQ